MREPLQQVIEQKRASDSAAQGRATPDRNPPGSADRMNERRFGRFHSQLRPTVARVCRLTTERNIMIFMPAGVSRQTATGGAEARSDNPRLASESTICS